MKPLRIAGLLILAILLLGTPPTRSASQPQQLTTTTTTVSSQPMEDSVSPRSEASTDVQSPDVVQSSAVATEYTFSSASGTYTEFTGGLSCGGGTFAMGVNIGFPFHYNGGTYTSLTINSNGFVTIGDGNVTLSACNYKPLSHPDGRCDNAVAPLGMALEGNPASIVRRGMIGTAPNRIFIVQWKDYRTAGAAANAESFNFQIRLHETTDLIEFVYGSFSKDSTDRNAQVGIRGSALTDFNSRTTTTDWANSIASMSSQGTMLLSTIVSPTVGLTFAWTPVAILDLSSSYKTAPAFTPPGAPLTYTVHIANTGHATATTASLLDSVPANVTYNTGSVACSSGACSYDGGVNAVRWNGSVAPFTTALVTFTVNTDGLSWADTITNTATLSNTSLYTSMVVSAVSVYGYATRPVVLSPNPLNFAGCNDGTCQTRAITLLNNTNITDTFDLSYTLDEPLFGTVTGPSTATLLNGEAISLSVTLMTPLCLPDNIDITGKIQAVARSTPYSDTATFNKLITTTPSWTSVPDSKPGWGGSGYPGDGCTAKNAAGQWVTYIMGDAYSGSSLSGFVGYNHATNTWSQMNAINQPAERWQPDWAYDADTNLCYLTGGSNTPNPGVGTYNEAYRYDPVTNAFTPLGNFTTVRNFHDSWVGLVNGIQMLCVGGGINTSGALASTQCYDLSQTAPGVWATENATLGPFPATTWGAADGVLHATTGDQFWSVAGVVSDTVTPNIRYWDDADSTWHTVAAGGWVRYRVEGDFVNSDFYIVGGSLDGSSLIPLAAASRYHFDGQHWVWTDLGYMTNSRADNVANAGGNALWSVDGYGGNSTSYVERLDVCPACTERGKIMGHVYDYDGVNPPITSYQLKLMPGNVTIPLDASGAYTKELVPWPYRLTASANGYPASVTATLQVQNSITLSHDFVLARPDVVVNPTTLSDVLYVADTPVSATHIVVLTNVGTLPLNFKIQEVKPEEQTYAIQAIKSISSSVAPLVVEPALAKQMTEQGQGSYLIDLRERADLSPAYGMNWHDRGWFVLKALQAVAERSQAKVRAYLDTQGVKYQSLWIDNLIAVENSNKAAFVGLQTFPEIAALRTVPTVVLDQPQPVSPLLQAPTSIEPNLTHIKADQVWAQGITGTGIIVANIDTGVRYTHQALVRQYRGNLGGGVFDHSYNWYDPVDHSTTPNDADTGSPSHGSHTMGTLVGDDGAGNQVGVAPGAQWIACQAFKPRGTFLSAIECGQFLAAPTDIAGNNPNPDMRPHIINNSWAECNTPGVYFPWYDGVLDTWHAAGIYPVFGMGNTDANCLMSGLGTVLSPAASARVTAVGALGRADGTLAGYSLWGPTDQIDTWNPLGYPSLKPQLSAPGTNRSVNGRYNDTGYADGSGTSMATPHVAGVIALMWSAAPCMIGNYTDTETILMQTALTTTTPGYPGSAWDGPNGKPNQATGWGEVNAKAAVDAAMDFCTYNWNPWVSETPAQGTLAPVGNLPIEVALTCTYSDTLKPQPLQSQLVLKDNDPADHAVALSLECLTSPLRLSQYTTATSGEVISQALVITSAGNFSSTAVLTDALPSGLSYVGNLTATAGVAWDSANIIHWMYTGTATTTMPAVVTITFAAQTAGDYSWNGSQGTAWDNANNWTSSVLHNTVWLGWEETNGLVLHLPLDEVAGATTFADVSGNNNQGGCTLASCPTAGVIGKQGQAVQFDGTDDVITVADAPSLRNSAFTLSAWFQWDGMGTSAVNFLTAKGLENMELQTGGGAGVNGLRFIPAGYPKTNVDATNVITTGWNHVAATYDGNTATLYVNGVSVGSRTGITNANNLITDAHPFYIGRRSDGTFPFDGVIDDVRVYRRILSASEIANLAKLREGHIRSTRDVTLTGWPGLHANATLPAGAATYPVLNVNTGVNNLIIQSGGALTIPVGITLTVESGLVNSGTLSIQRNVSGPSATNFHLYNSSLAPTYYGVQVTPSTTLGPTWVEIHGNTQCTTALPLDTVNRCVRITPQITNTSALVRMYYRTDELAGHDPATLQLWQRSNSSWLPLGSMRGSVSDGGYVEGVATTCEAATEFALTEPLPQLSLSKSVTPMINVPYHGVVTYTILFSNTETISDTHARLTDTLPANITFGQWVAQPSGVVRTGNVVTWTGTLTNNTVLTFIFTATHTGSYDDIVTNTAWLSGTIQTGSASAVFSVNPSYTLTVGLSGNGSGVVTSLPTGITCGAQCAATYEAGQLITLTATPLPNSTFIVWSGAGVTTTNPLTLLINATRQVTATFALNTYIITPTAGVGGSLTPSTPQTVNYGDSITFTITADNGYQIDDVSVDGISHGALDSYTFTNVTANHALSATFALKNTCEPISDVGFSFSPLRPLIGEPVQFTGTVVAGTAPLTYTWDWGDGTAAGLGAVLSHAFPLTATVRAYTVTLAVNNQCSGPLTAEQAVAIMPQQVFLPLALRDQ